MTNDPQAPALRRGLSGSTLKLIAVGTMLLDHVGAVVVERGVILSDPHRLMSAGWWQLDMLLRYGFGRVAFPIFCFLLVEGFEKTHDRRRYALRLGLFCLLSEIPFDLAFSGTPVDWPAQNVFFTLTIGFCTLWGVETVFCRPWSEGRRRVAACGILLAGMGLAELLHTDYSAFGVLFIFLFYVMANRPERQRNLVLGLACAWEFTAPLALIPIHFYNGQRGWRLKYIFYCFYPVHLLLLALLTRLLFGV